MHLQNGNSHTGEGAEKGGGLIKRWMEGVKRKKGAYGEWWACYISDNTTVGHWIRKISAKLSPELIHFINLLTQCIAWTCIQFSVCQPSVCSEAKSFD